MLSPVEEIKSRLDIVELLQTYTKLEKAGVNYKATCPFHSEKTPSFFVSPARQIWHCFGGCGEGGDMFKFIMKIEGLEFREALQLLAERAGVILKKEDPRVQSERNRMYDICEDAAQFFEQMLAQSPPVHGYLKERGLADAVIKTFRLGWSPAQWDAVVRYLASRGWKNEEIGKAGLAIAAPSSRLSASGRWYDRFRNRIMFPIADANSRIIGFGGRIFAQETGGREPEATGAKYVNTPQTMIYDKSRVLYGFDKAKNEIRAKNSVIVVEGYMDCIMSHQAGAQNTIAISGTALTPQHLQFLKRLCGTVIISFDADGAGDSATKRSLALAAQFGFERRVAAIPLGKDPADTVRVDPHAWQKAVRDAKNAVEFFFEKAKKEHNPKTAEGKKGIASSVLPYIAELFNEIEKAHWVGALAAAISVSEEAVWKELQKIKPDSGYRAGERENVNDTAQETSGQRKKLLEERLLSLLTISDNADFRKVIKEAAGAHLTFSSPLYERLCSLLTQDQTSWDTIISQCTDEERGALDLFRFKGEALMEITQNLDSEFASCTREFEKECVRERLLELGEKIRHHESVKNEQDVPPLLRNFRTLSDKLKTLS